LQKQARQTRENRTITIDFQNEATYCQLLGDGKAFVECVFAFLLSLGFQLKHKATCRGGGCLTRHSPYVRVRLGRVTIWRVQCTTCKAVIGSACRRIQWEVIEASYSSFPLLFFPSLRFRFRPMSRFLTSSIPPSPA